MSSFLATLQNLDAHLLQSMRNWIDPQNEIIVKSIHFGADVLLVFMPVYLIIVWFVGVSAKKPEPKEYAIKIFLSAVLGVIFCLLLNALLPFRPRPETVSTIAPLISHLPDNSFPSMHATFASAVIGALWVFYFPFLREMAGKMGFLFSREIRIIITLLGVYMVLSRIFAGIHYPGDIIAGIVLGGASTLIIRILSMQEWFYKGLIQFPIKIASFLKL